MSDDLGTRTRQHWDRATSSHMAAADPFHWQLNSMDHYALEEELRTNVRDLYSSAVAASTHTLFQEQHDVAGTTEHDPFQHRRLEEQCHNFATAIGEADRYGLPPSIARNATGFTSPFSLDSEAHVNEASFMGWFPQGDATLTFTGEDGQLQYIHNINLWLIGNRCPLLSTAFEQARSGLQLHLDVLTPLSAYPFVRFLYTGNCALTNAAGDQSDDVPTSVLMHVQLYRLAVIFELEELRQQAYVNVLRQCEYGCSSPEKPIDVCAAIEYAYDHLAEHANLLDALVNYSVTCFLQHRLAEDEHFKRLAHDIHPFHQALCRESMGREHEVETASAIIRLPFKPRMKTNILTSEELRNCIVDEIYHFHSTEEMESTPKRRRDDSISDSGQMDTRTLVLRPRSNMCARQQGVSSTKASDSTDKHCFGARAPAEAGEGDGDNESDYEMISRPAEVEELDSSDESGADLPGIMQRPIQVSLRAWAQQIAVEDNARHAEPESDMDDWTVIGND